MTLQNPFKAPGSASGPATARAIACGPIDTSHADADNAIMPDPACPGPTFLADGDELPTGYRVLFQHDPDAVFLIDRHGRIAAANDEACELIGARREDLIGRTYRTFLSRESYQAARKGLRDVLNGGSWQSEVIALTPAGGWTRMAVTSVPVCTDDDVVGAYVITKDVNRERRLAEQNRLGAEALRQAGEAVMVLDASGEVRWVNKAYEDIVGLPEAEVVGRLGLDLVAEEDREAIRAVARQVEEAGFWRGQLDFGDGRSRQRRSGLCSISALRDEDGTISHYIAVFSDTTELKRYQRRLEFLAHHDPLTRLPNRALLEDRIRKSIQRARRHGTRFALLHIDVDRLKHVNDSFGHAAGDEVIVAVGQRLAGTVREADTVARLSGDEFVVVLDDMSRADDSVLVAEKIRRALEDPLSISGHTLYMSASIGIACWPEHGEDLETLLRNADNAMYRAKRAGPNTYRLYDPSYDNYPSRLLELQTELRQALVRDELSLHYQPIVDLAGGATIGFEALLRWNSQVLGPVSPDEFLPVAEESGMIGAITEWVLATALRDGKALLAAAPGVRYISVNVSVRDVHQPGFSEHVRRVLTDEAVAPCHLQIELTETAAMDDVRRTQEALSELRDLGVIVALDDFGTGYSSLGYLKDLPLDALKIDKSFTRHVCTDRSDQALVRTTVALAREFGLGTIAEGVETDEQRKQLLDFGCHQGQGYAFCPPLPLEEAKGILEQREPASPGADGQGTAAKESCRPRPSGRSGD